METYDVAVVGSGPAGSTFARTADKNLKILLIDGNRTGKPCGGLLAPDAQKALARFDLTLPKDILVDPQIFSVRTIDIGSKTERYYQRMYINIDRLKFDRWLLSLVGGNVTVFNGNCLEISRSEGGFSLRCSGESGKTEFFAKALVGADGASSIVRKTFFKPLHTRRYVAIQEWFATDSESPNPFYSCIFDDDPSSCCSWSIYKDGFVIFGGAFKAQGCRGTFERQKKKLEQFGYRLHDPVKTEACTVLRPTGIRSFCCGGDGVFLIGEAAGFISPSSFEGISSAINSAVALSDALKSNRKNKLAAYKHLTVSLRRKLILKNLKCPFMYAPLLRRLTMASGITAISVIEEKR